jgi:hypothetical protein
MLKPNLHLIVIVLLLELHFFKDLSHLFDILFFSVTDFVKQGWLINFNSHYEARKALLP